MSRVEFAGGQVFDGTGTAPGAADVVIEGGRIVEVGTGLDGARTCANWNCSCRQA